ncbi:MAG TPA: FmdB family zinc ribbon protein [Candidatus Sulfotelmatobacter sp.]|nr:FmdB family zinc ribbon protein [Candidatus Sulfotelmatobacter sp.]
MPIYEYRCTACQHTFEVMQKFSDRPVKKCPQCKGKVEKLLSAPGLLFKGSGWYVTDYANASRKKSMEAEKGASGNGGDKSSEKKEAKAEKTDAKSGKSTKDAKASD